MTRSRPRPTFPPPPPSVPAPPSVWLSIDPGGTKATAIAMWSRSQCVSVRQIASADLADRLRSSLEVAGLVVLEDGFAGRANPQATAQLSETRGAVCALASVRGVPVVRVLPDRWRRVLGLPSRRAKGAPTLASDAARLCRMLAGAPDDATNEDTRAAYLIGEACVRAWGWDRALGRMEAADAR